MDLFQLQRAQKWSFLFLCSGSNEKKGFLRSGTKKKLFFTDAKLVWPVAWKGVRIVHLLQNVIFVPMDKSMTISLIVMERALNSWIVENTLTKNEILNITSTRIKSIHNYQSVLQFGIIYSAIAQK